MPEVTAMVSKFGNSAKTIVPGRVIAFLHSDFVSKHQGMKERGNMRYYIIA
jgi:hypothetical protein